MAANWVLIANPTAGRGRGRQVAEKAAAALEKAGHPVDLRFTRQRGHGTELAHQAVRQGAERLIVCGGDGTIREVLPALVHSKTALGLLPFGTANDFSRALGIPRQLNDAVRNLFEGQTCCIDLGQVGECFFCTVATFGFDSTVTHAVSSGQVPFSGTLGYLWAVLKIISTYPLPVVRLQGEFGEYEGKVLLVASGNTASYGGGMKIAPQANPRDGKLDVCIVGQVSTPTLLSILPRLFWGGHVDHQAVRVERTAWLDIETLEPQIIYADGDYLGETPAAVKVVPLALNAILPTPLP